MKLFKYTLGVHESYGVFTSEQEAYEKRSIIDQVYDYTPVEITEVSVPGYEIILKPLDVPTDRDELKAWLTERNIDFTPQWGVEKLREAALQHKEGVV